MPPKTIAARPMDDEPEVIAPVTAEQLRTTIEEQRLSRIDEMRDYFRAQKRVRVKVHNDADVPVQVNGYTFIIQAGVNVDVPEDVAAILDEAGYL